ncbi:MAG: shikimate dehydrogenase [Bacteroidales bacterium]|nr:shikimate dehydrogenase [Bacteroidales bacterium]
MTHLFGLIGNPISHSLSPAYLQAKWQAEGITDCAYRLFPLSGISSLKPLLEQYPELCGLNVTSPYKETVLTCADTVDEQAASLRSANVLCIRQKKISAYNTDVEGFSALLETLPHPLPAQALVLGSGGASRTVCAVLSSKGIQTAIVSRTGKLNYQNLTPSLVEQCKLIINATPLGIGPWKKQAPDIPYQAITPEHLLTDLNYHPSETRFLQFGKKQGAQTFNGLKMLHAQADASWKIWKQYLTEN